MLVTVLDNELPAVCIFKRPSAVIAYVKNNITQKILYCIIKKTCIIDKICIAKGYV